MASFAFVVASFLLLSADNTKPRRIKVGSHFDQGLITKVLPAYPQRAKEAHAQGSIRFEVVVGTDGTVLSLRLLSGHPLLVPAAMDAIKQWKYKPMRINEVAVEVVTQAHIEFKLDQ